jgi:NADH dehydrogenase
MRPDAHAETHCPRLPACQFVPRAEHLIITGGTGYIGQRLVEMARRDGRKITLLARRDGWKLGDALPPGSFDAALPADTQAIIHLAHDWKNAGGENSNTNLNRAGTRPLAEAARAAGARFVFVSSQSARPGAANIYGRTKWEIEQELTGPREVSARVGLVYGGPRRAQYGLLCRLVGIAPVLPMVDPWRQVQPIHLDEVCAGLLLLADNEMTGWVGLAGPEPLAFGQFLKALARVLHGKALPIVPIPLRLALLACDATAKIPFLPTVDRERVLGLAGFQPMDCAAQLRALGLEVRPVAAGLAGEPMARRVRLGEARAGLTFVLGRPPGLDLLRRAVRAIEAAEAPAGPVLPPAARAMPFLLHAIEPIGDGSALKRRLDLLAALAEASPDGEAALWRQGKSRGSRLGRIALRLAGEVLLLPFRLVATAVQWRPGRRR